MGNTSYYLKTSRWCKFWVQVTLNWYDAVTFKLCEYFKLCINSPSWDTYAQKCKKFNKEIGYTEREKYSNFPIKKINSQLWSMFCFVD